MAVRLALALSYIFDWVVVIALAAADGVLNYISGFHRPFSLTDASIAFPSKPDIVSIPVVVVVALVIPAAIIAVFNLSAVFLFHDRTEKDRFRRMLWEIHAGLLETSDRVKEKAAKRRPAVAKWASLDHIVGKVASPDEVYQALMGRAGKYASATSKLQYLTRLFFNFAGPYAFEQIRCTFSALHCATDFDPITLGGCVRALNRLVQAGPIEKRALVVSLCNERTRLQTCAEIEGEGRPDVAALNEMVASAYPGLEPTSKAYAVKKGELQRNLDRGQHWVTAHERSPSALFSVPTNVSETIFRLIPRDLASAFFDLLYSYRGQHLRRVDELLGPIVVAFIHGQRPSQAFPLGHINLGQMKKYPMDSEHFIEISRIVASSMSPLACQLE